MITIGGVFGGPEYDNSQAKEEFSRALRAAKTLRDTFELGTGPAVNVVFYFPGRVSSPDWTGLRDGTFSRKRQMLMIQVAVPVTVLASTSISEFIIDSLHRANTLAVDVFLKKRMTYPFEEAEQLVRRIEDRIKGSAKPEE